MASAWVSQFVSGHTWQTYAIPPITEPGKLRNPPGACSETGIATGDFTTKSPARSPPKSSTAAWPGNIPALGAAITVANPADRQVSTRGSLGFTSSAAFRHGRAAGRSSGPREHTYSGRAPPSPAGAGGVEAATPTSGNPSIRPG